MASRKPRAPQLIIGWREYVSLPGLDLRDIKAKIDTGARTTALHASRIRLEKIDGATWVRFHPEHAGIDEAAECLAPYHAQRAITNTSGKPDERIIIKADLTIGGRTKPVEISLADRADMAFPIIIGRTALRIHRLVVDPARSWRAS